jgi:hypothetical protein
MESHSTVDNNMAQNPSSRNVVCSVVKADKIQLFEYTLLGSFDSCYFIRWNRLFLNQLLLFGSTRIKGPSNTNPPQNWR